MPRPASRKVSNDSQPPPIEGLQYTAGSKNQITESSVSDSSTSCSHGSTKGVETSTSSEALYDQGAGSLNEHSLTTKDYRTRDERFHLLHLDWSKLCTSTNSVFIYSNVSTPKNKSITHRLKIVLQATHSRTHYFRLGEDTSGSCDA